MQKEKCLLDILAEKMGCMYLSDLRYLTTTERLTLVPALIQMTPQDHSLFEWNDALEYLNAGAAESSIEAARSKLIKALSNY